MKKLLVVGDSFMHPDFKTSPGFHTDDPAWQNRMATEVRQILTTVDFC